MATHSSTLAWKIPWTEKPGRLQSMGSQRVRHDWATPFSLFTFHLYASEKEMAPHSRVLAWRIPGMGAHGGLLSMGSHRVGHDWSDLAAAALSLILNMAVKGILLKPRADHVSSVQLLSCVRLCVTPWTAARQASLFISNPWSLHKLMSIESVMPSNLLMFCCALLLLSSIFPSIRVFSNESVLYIRWPKY